MGGPRGIPIHVQLLTLLATTHLSSPLLSSLLLSSPQRNKSLNGKKSEEGEHWNITKTGIYPIRAVLRSSGTSNSRESNNLSPDDVNGQFCFSGSTTYVCTYVRVHRDCRVLHLAHGNAGKRLACSPGLVRMSQPDAFLQPPSVPCCRWSNLSFHLSPLPVIPRVCVTLRFKNYSGHSDRFIASSWQRLNSTDKFSFER